MPEIVPMLEFMHLLSSEGVDAEYAQVAGRPQAYWDRLAPGSRDRFLAGRQAEGRGEDVVGVQVVRRRGKPEAIENVYLLVDFGKGSAVSRMAGRARRRLLYHAFVAPDAGGHVEDLLVPEDALFATLRPGEGRVCHLLDLVWGGEPYDAERDGALCEPVIPSGSRLVDEYWLEAPFAKAVLLEDEGSQVGYHVVEPQLSALEEALLVTLNERLRDVLVLEPGGAGDRSKLLVRRLFELLGMYRFRTDRRTAYKLGYYFVRNYLGLGPIEPIMRDPHVEDISCNGPRLPVFVAHSRHQSVRSNVAFHELELNSFTMKLAQRGGKLLSVATPLVDATLPNGSRLQAALGHEVTSRGSAFTIRKFREDPLTAVDLIRHGTHSLDTMAVLWLATEMRRSLVVMGATASGKTTTLNALGQFIPPAMKIVSIEDTREITLQHENWLAAVTRESFGGATAEKVTMFDLLRAALRQRPDYLIVGEIRGVEGLTLFQAMSTGHTCFSTMHAGSVENAVYRLENPPINVPRVMLTSLDFLVTQGQVEVKGRPARRMLAITEINGLDPQSRNLRVNELFRWDAATDTHPSVATSNVFDRARAKGGWTRTRLEEEFVARKRVLERLVARNERHYSDVAKAVRRFYAERVDEHGWIGGPVNPVAGAPLQAGGAPPPVDIPQRSLLQPGAAADRKSETR
ncbi:MAG TPA: type II/IV secretion system ATPase subunit [Candidatus Thermoplasmatota archaeon]|nr:type II/IV secretion system ATPase subunit [Candidatus Thermoplasmatota archaeon]